jgi:chlorite dismutase
MEDSTEIIDISEKGRSDDGRPVSTNRRLYMQLQVYAGCDESKSLVEALDKADISGVLYEDIHDPQGVAILSYSETPEYFIGEFRRFLNQSPFVDLMFRPEYTMFGRTYALGHEPDLVRALITQPIHKVCNRHMPWAIWYPLRRGGSFEQLSAQEQRVILMEHGGVGRAFGRAGLGTDIRLACHGLDRNDNDFVIGLIGPELYPLSSIVQRMRKTKQTSLHLERLGPFFVGKAVWQR